MPDVDEIGGWITGQLPAPIAKYKVPGAAIGVFRSGEVFAFAVGVLSHATKVEATADSVFQIELFDVPGGFIFGHDGSTIGQYFDVYGHLLKEMAGIDLPATPVPSASPKRIDAIRYLGVYANSVGKSTVTQDCNGRIWMTAELIGEVEQTELVHLEGDTLIPLEPKYEIRIPQVFSGDDGSGRSLYIHSGRALRRAD
jgi:hypothetical protein